MNKKTHQDFRVKFAKKKTPMEIRPKLTMLNSFLAKKQQISKKDKGKAHFHI